MQIFSLWSLNTGTFLFVTAAFPADGTVYRHIITPSVVRCQLCWLHR